MTPPPARADAPPPIGFGRALLFWLKLGFISFGGPAGQIAIMHSELVERRRWISEKRFLHALNYCMVLPGPEAQQLATYLGWLMHRSWGGIAAGLLFVLPSLVLLIGLSWVYVVFGQQPLVAAVFYGIKPAVTAIVLQAGWRLAGRALHSRALVGIAAAAFVAMAVLHLPFVLVLALAALAGHMGARRWPAAFQGRAAHAASATALGDNPAPAAWIDDHSPPPAHARFSRGRLLRVLGVCLALWAAGMGAAIAIGGLEGTLARMGWFFTKAALMTFGGAYAVLPYVYQAAVEHYHWLSGPQMIDGLALGETTPGPLIMVVAFVGFLGGWNQLVLGPDMPFLGGALAAVAVSFFTFLPSFLFILAGGPLVESTRGHLGLAGPMTAITAAVVGVIAQLALFFAGHVLWPDGRGFDGWAAALMVLAAFALIRLKWGVMPVLALSAVAGLGIRMLG
ncbi:chromate efflux transporter [Pseudacidovorax sp. RU35E]|uniref:chromate efflux transporter n=1 Tax=Pseudacidovorax sp. RU35E TaxID=1907403 RepID=UPI000954FE73|nr:chromate efflux transporter [Pseudacidovorax sp. RU35E]SIP90261.1 chromate transporter [Pseudacidovorax sp. RU35E]